MNSIKLQKVQPNPVRIFPINPNISAKGTQKRTRSRLNKLACQSKDGLHIVSISAITHCVAESNYASIYIGSERAILVSKTLSTVQAALIGHGFIRTHQSYLVNANYVKAVHTNHVALSCGAEIPLSRSKRFDVREQVLNNACSL